VAPQYGIKTGLNEAFLIDTATRDKLVAQDARANDIIKPYLRGQDVGRWCASWQDLWMIFARRGIDIDAYPSVKAHLSTFRTRLEPRPSDWKPPAPGQKWPGRKEGTYAWYELQDAIDYWQDFAKPKIVYQVIQFHARYCLDRDGRLSNDKTFFLPTADPWLIAVLNSPLMWWHNWRYLTHLKDEALSPMGYRLEVLSIAAPQQKDKKKTAAKHVDNLVAKSKSLTTAANSTLDWLHHEFEITKPGRVLSDPTRLDADQFIAAVRDAVPKKHKLSAASLAELRREHAATIEPARLLRAEIFTLERELSDLVNAAYGLTPEDINLMWRTAPPRMPFTPEGLTGPVDQETEDTDDNGDEDDE
jgi:hypothetical protein